MSENASHVESRNCDIVFYSSLYKEGLLTLQTELWSNDLKLNRRYFEWKYERNPYFEKPFIFLAICDDRVVGMRGMFGTRWQVGCPKHCFDAPYADDLVIAPEFRNQGLHSRIMRAALLEATARGYKFIFNLSGGRITVLSSLAMGWKSVGAMLPAGRASEASGGEKLRKILRAAPLLRRFSGSRWLHHSRECRPFRVLDQSAAAGKLKSEGIALELAPRSEAMAALVEQASRDGRLRQVRDARYLSWRFQNPLHEYRFLYLPNGDTLEGYLVLQRYAERISGRVHVVDWEACNRDASLALMRAAIDFGDFSELVTWTASLDADRLQFLTDLDFCPVDMQMTARGHPCALIRSLSSSDSDEQWIISGRDLLDFSNWDLRMIFSMHG